MNRRAAVLAALWLAALGHAREPKGLTPSAWNRLKADGRYHTGEGWAEIKNDIGEARESAQARALADLARALRVAVRATMTDRLTSSAGRARQDIESTVETFTELALRQPLDERAVFLHHPRRGVVTAVAALSRRRYAELLEKSWREKNAQVSRLRDSAAAAEEAGRTAEAARRLGEALEETRRGSEELGPALETEVRSRVGDLTGGWKLSCAPAVVFYEEGRDPAPIRLRARLAGGRPFAGAPVAAAWTHRPRHPVASAVTDARGAAQIAVDPDTFAERPTLAVDFDWAALSLPPSKEEPACRVRFAPRPVIRVRASGAPPALCRTLEVAARGALEDLAWKVGDGRWALPGEAPEGSEPADFGLDLKVRVEEKKHPLVDLYRVRVTATAGFYDFSSMVWGTRFALPSVEVEGDDAAAALEEAWEGWSAEAAEAVRAKAAGLLPN